MRSLFARIPVRGIALFAVALLVPTIFASSAAAGAASTSQGDRTIQRYDREGLLLLTRRYLAALVAHDPTAVPLARGIRTVENLQQIAPGQGLWATATGGPTSFAIYVPDPQLQTAGFIGVMEQNGAPILLGLRLKMEDGKITEAEHLIASGLTETNLANLQTPRPGLLAEIPRGQRLPEHKLREIGATYYNALDDNVAGEAPFAADCERHENGIVTAGPNLPPPPPESGIPAVATDCIGQIDSKVFTYIETIGNRRVFAADPVTGLAIGLSQFHQPMDNIPYEITLANGTTEMYAPNFPPFDLPAAHIWKIGPDHQLHEIEAMGFVAPLNSPSGW
ncbi:MAG: hypothetical protein J2P28_24280 [Actinobacteria bacterium]|nr:hypothetical protein [Actinomycetota bacterium]